MIPVSFLRALARSAAQGVPLILLLVVALGSVCAIAQTPEGKPGGGVDAPEPPPPRYSTAYDGALARVREGRADQALEQIEQALKGDARNPQLRFLKGVLLAQGPKPDQAVAVFSALIEDYPELPEPYNNLAVLRAQANDWEGARQVLTRAVAALPTYALAQDNLGEVHLHLAEQAFAKAAQSAPPGEPSARKLALTRELIQQLSTLSAPKPTGPGAPERSSAPSDPRSGAASNPRPEAPLPARSQ
jgi:tetratricopeptide (TPR) repeat protein